MLFLNPMNQINAMKFANVIDCEIFIMELDGGITFSFFDGDVMLGWCWDINSMDE